MKGLDNLICWDPGDRGISKIFPIYEKRYPDFTRKSAQKLIKNVDDVVIIVGFPINTEEDGYKGETDGPLGAIQLHRTIEKIGGSSRILTIDPYYDAIKSMADEVIRIDEIEEGFNPSALVSIEVPGENPGGYFDLTGNSVYSEEVDMINKLFMETEAPKISIGDGGNEIGMGKIRDLIKENVGKGDEIFSGVESDHLVISGTSNWGAYGIISELSVIENENFLHSGKIEERMLINCLENGLVDGVTKNSERSVDGLPSPVLKSFLNLLRDYTDWRISKT